MKSRRNEESLGIGGIYCPHCDRFFDDYKRRVEVYNYKNCSQHQGMNGYRLVDRLKDGSL